MKYFILIIASALSFLTASCATRDTTSTGLNVMSESAYQSIVDEYSDSTERYSGLYNTITMRSTILNSKVAHAQLDQNARLFLWDKAKYDDESKKVDQKLNKESEIFLSFYTPTRKHDNLNRSKTLWKIFLDVDGKRYEGKATKIKLLTTELQSIYPYHNSFSTPYSLIFPVPMKTIEKSNAKLTITGPVGSANQNYPGMAN